jgi:hypothetical protein
MLVNIAFHLTDRFAPLSMSPWQLVQGNIHLHAFSVPQLCLSLGQPSAGLVAPFSESRVASFGQVLHGVGPIQDLDSPGGQVAVNQIPNPLSPIIHGRNPVCGLDPPPSQFDFQGRREGLFIP